MLLVATRIGPSRIHGTGVFAVSPIAAGTAVWRFERGLDLELDPRVADGLPEHVRSFLAHYGYIDRRAKRLILCFDHARFINHSDNPNVAPNYSEHPLGLDVAVRDIAADEEITVDYAGFDEFSRPA
jgi:SET domain-containing protein